MLIDGPCCFADPALPGHTWQVLQLAAQLLLLRSRLQQGGVGSTGVWGSYLALLPQEPPPLLCYTWQEREQLQCAHLKVRRPPPPLP
jgi:hypothetical protein